MVGHLQLEEDAVRGRLQLLAGSCDELERDRGRGRLSQLQRALERGQPATRAWARGRRLGQRGLGQRGLGQRGLGRRRDLAAARARPARGCGDTGGVCGGWPCGGGVRP